MFHLIGRILLCDRDFGGGCERNVASLFVVRTQSNCFTPPTALPARLPSHQVTAGCLTYTGKLYAVKCMNKKLIKGKKALKLIKSERDILKSLGDDPSPFVISLKYAFEDTNNFYLVLPLLSGGDLSFHLKELGGFSKEQ